VSVLEDQIRECFGRVVYTHKTHERMADLCTDRLHALKLGQIVLNGLTSCGVLALMVADEPLLKVATAVISFASFSLAAYLKGFDPGGTAQKHRDAGATLWDIRESYLSLLTDLRRQVLTDAEATAHRNQLQALLAKIYKGVPQTNGRAYEQARAALKDLDHYTFSDAEIDAFLPTSLKKTAHEAS